jgi:hypothetical protein
MDRTLVSDAPEAGASAGAPRTGASPGAPAAAPIDVARMGAFFERLGHRIVATGTAHWYDFYRGFYVSFPHHAQIAPARGEVGRLFRGLTAGVRYVAPPESPGRPSYAMMCADRAYDLARLSANTRSKVRRGLSRCRIERMDPAFVRAHGRQAHEDTLVRIGVRDPYPWDTYWGAVEQSDCTEVWGAVADGQLVAYLVGVLADRCLEIMVARSSNEALRDYPNNALVYTVVRDVLSRPGMASVWFGIESLEGAQRVDDFKLSMGFEKAPIRQRIVLHPLLRPALRSGLVRRALGAMADRRPQNEMWRKLRNLASFQAEGAPAA